MDKKKALGKIADKILVCKICKIGKSGLGVPGEGNPNAEIVFVGEAPGKNEALTGRPFVGRSGKLLRGLILKAGFLEDEVFITSPVKYLPDKGTPSSADIAHGRIHLDEQLKVIDPKVVVLLGNVAAKAVLGDAGRGDKIMVKKDHGRIIESGGRKYLITLHPAAVLRFPSLGVLIRQDFGKLRAIR
jgi:DNA polymerase